MTSSAKQTRSPLSSLTLVFGVLVGFFLLGSFLILDANQWHVGAPVVILVLGWMSVLFSGATLCWSAAAMASEDPESPDQGFELSTRQEELQQEKSAMLKAIKEIEFDHNMGKMSEADASQITKAYRRRAIAIIKELERRERGERALTPGELIEEELRARLAIDKVAGKKTPKKKLQEVVDAKLADEGDSESETSETEGEGESESENLSEGERSDAGDDSGDGEESDAGEESGDSDESDAGDDSDESNEEKSS